jgi:iron complex transport system ATP-binding protein
METKVNHSLSAENQVCRFGDHLIAMKDGAIVAEGNPRQVITEAVVQDVFSLAVKVIPDPVAGTPMVVPIGRHTTHTDRSASAETPTSSPAAAALAASAAANGVCRPTDS